LFIFLTYPEIYDEVMATYKKYGRSSMEKDVQQYSVFFKETGNRLRAVD